MLKHIVMWRLKDFAEGNQKEKNILVMKEMLESLKNDISEIISLEVGVNVIPSPAAYDLVLYSEFKNKESLDIYIKHPAHVKVADFIGKIRSERVVVDYEV